MTSRTRSARLTTPTSKRSDGPTPNAQHTYTTRLHVFEPATVTEPFAFLWKTVQAQQNAKGCHAHRSMINAAFQSGLQRRTVLNLCQSRAGWLDFPRLPTS